jgi:DNA (cytosine-5)-methyltransferase 1
MTLGSLFSGRGGFEIGAKQVGIETLWTCETNEFLHHKLKRIIPNAKHYRDVKLAKTPPKVDIVSAGFPCQDISISNHKNREGINGNRSGLWKEVARITDEIKPSYLVLENSPELLKQGFEYVLRDLSCIGYNAEWDCWRAADFGYPHNRRRLYLIAYPMSIGLQSNVLEPPCSFELSQTQRDYEFPNFGNEIGAFGNAVMPVVAEHLFRCILKHSKKIQTENHAII